MIIKKKEKKSSSRNIPSWFSTYKNYRNSALLLIRSKRFIEKSGRGKKKKKYSVHFVNSRGAISRDMKTAAKSDGGRSEIGKQRFTKLCPKGLKLRTTRDRNKQLLSSGSIPCDIDASGQTDSRGEATRPRPPGVIPTIYQIQCRVRAANISTGIRFTCKMPASYNTVPRIFQTGEQTSFVHSTWKPSIVVVIDRKSVNEFYRKCIKLIFKEQFFKASLQIYTVIHRSINRRGNRHPSYLKTFHRGNRS